MLRFDATGRVHRLLDFYGVFTPLFAASQKGSFVVI
jgi:hypothetical protein